jgi:hypothetical protein
MEDTPDKCSSPVKTRMIKPKIIWVRHAVNVRIKRKTCRVSVGNPA